jgi:hypothetical protein
MSRITLEKAKAAKRTARKQFERLGSVTAVGITRVDGEYAVKVNLCEPLGEGVDPPREIDGVPVCVVVTGAVRAEPMEETE